MNTTPIDPCVVRLELDPHTFDMLDQLGRLADCGGIVGLFEQLADHVADGVRRPHADEREWLEQVLGSDWEKALEPERDDPIFEHFPRRCGTCGRVEGWAPHASDDECNECEHRRRGAEAAALRGGRPLPCYMDGFTEIREREGMDTWPALGRPPEHFEAKARAAGADLHGEKENPMHGGCLGCDLGHMFWCVGCDRWRCFCRGGYESPAVLRSCCDQCGDVYRDALEPAAQAVLRLLELRIGLLTPPGFVDEHLAGAVGRLVSCTPWPPGSSGHASKRMQRRAVRLGLRALRGARPLARLGAIVAGWPVCGNHPLQTKLDDYGTELLLAADGNGLRTACPDDWEAALGEQRVFLKFWAWTLTQVFWDRAAAAMFARVPQLRWLAGGAADDALRPALRAGVDVMAELADLRAMLAEREATHG